MNNELEPSVGPEGPGWRRPIQDALAVMVGLTAVVAVMFAAYTSGFGKPSPHEIPVAVLAPAAMTVQLATSPALEVHPVTSASAAQQMVLNRHAYGAIDVMSSTTMTLYVANGGGHSVALALQSVATTLAHDSGSRLKVVDLAPTSRDDPNGTVEFYCIVFLAIGGALGATVLGRVLGAVRDLPHMMRRIISLIGYSAMLAGAVTILADPVFHALIGHPWGLFVTLWAYSLTICLAASGVTALFGPLAGMALTLGLTVIGNPSAGGALDQHLLNPFFAAFTPVLPHGAALSVIRGVLYFGGRGIGDGLLCLGIWAGIGLAMLFLFAHQRGRAAQQPNAPAEPTADPGAPAGSSPDRTAAPTVDAAAPGAAAVGVGS